MSEQDQSSSGLSRRDFLKLMGAAGTALAFAPFVPWLAVSSGLILGKPIGIMFASWLIVASGLGRLPSNVTWLQVLGVSALAGVGFTMSIFIGELAYTDVNIINQAKFGVLIGSLVSGVIGYLILNRFLPRTP